MKELQIKCYKYSRAFKRTITIDIEIETDKEYYSMLSISYWIFKCKLC